MNERMIDYCVPEDMEQYLSYYGHHFNKKLCEWAIGQMKKEDKATGLVKKLTPLPMAELKTILEKNKVEINDNDWYDALYLANMVKADYWGSSIEDDEHMAKYIEDVNSDWGVLICYHYNIMDYDDIWAICRSFNLSETKTNEALHVLREPNTGMTISNADIRMSVVFVSDTTSEDEWWSTLSHELWHVATSIIDYYDEPYDEEPAAYLYGELMRLAINEIGEPCR